MPRSLTVWRSCLLTLLGFCLAVASPNIPTAHAQEKPKQPAEVKLPAEQPQFGLSGTGDDAATLMIGVGAAPSVGTLQAVTVLTVGAKEPLLRWRFERPPELPPVIHGASLLFLAGAQARFGPPGGLFPPVDPAVWCYMGDKLNYFSLMDTSKVQKLPPLTLIPVVDEQGIPDPTTAPLELDAYYAMLHYAWHTDKDAFLREARRDVGYAHLMNMPKRYRGEVIFVKGRLRLVKKFPTDLALQVLGVPSIYEGWVFANDSSSMPVCILFTELPEGITPEEKINREVGFAGYFFKKYRYTAVDQRGKNQQKRDAPLLIGRMPSVIKGAAQSDNSEMDRKVLNGFLIVVVGTLLGVLALVLWFRFHDMRVRRKLEEATRREFVLPPPDVEEKFQPTEVTNGGVETTENWRDGSEPTRTGEPELNRGTHNRMSELPPP